MKHYDRSPGTNTSRRAVSSPASVTARSGSSRGAAPGASGQEKKIWKKEKFLKRQESSGGERREKNPTAEKKYLKKKGKERGEKTVKRKREERKK